MPDPWAVGPITFVNKQDREKQCNLDKLAEKQGRIAQSITAQRTGQCHLHLHLAFGPALLLDHIHVDDRSKNSLRHNEIVRRRLASEIQKPSKFLY